jgi:hypothetical protein
MIRNLTELSPVERDNFDHLMIIYTVFRETTNFMAVVI